MQQLASLPQVPWLILLIPIVIAVFRYHRLLPGLFFVCGAAWSADHAMELLQQFVPPALEKQTVVIAGEVIDLPIRHGNRARFDFRIDSASYNQAPVKLPRQVRLSVYGRGGRKPWAPAVGSLWQLPVRLKNPHGFQNPGGFDYEAHLFANRIRATGYVVPKGTPVYLGEGGWRQGINRLRARAGQRLGRLIGNHRSQGVLAALSIGDRQGLTGDDWALLQHTGTSHLVAISGLHLSLVSGLVFFLIRVAWGRIGYLCKRLPAQKAAAIAAFISALGYAGMAGFAIPTQRALIMLGVVYLALLFSRQPFRAQTLAIALFGVLVYDPLTVLSASFWLSFTAVSIIFLVTGLQTTTHRWRQGVRLQWYLSLGLIPVTILFFQNASLVSPLANLVAIPVYGLLVVPMTLTGLMLPDVIGQQLLSAAAFVADLGWQWLVFVESYLPFYFRTGSPGIFGILLVMCGAMLMMFPGIAFSRWLGLVFCLPLFWQTEPPPRDHFRATLLDVGQGLSLVVQTRRHVLVYDTGARFSDRFNAGDAALVPFLRDQGIGRIDTVLISHGDNDHVGGLKALRKSFRIDHVISNVRSIAPSEGCVSGKFWNWEGIRFEILHPKSGWGGKDNNSSCVLRISNRDTSLLVTGDIEKRAEKELVAVYGDRLRSNYLVAPHHGSRTSSTPAFLETVAPERVLVPAGHLNRYRHPSAKVTARYEAHGIPWLVSGNQGAIRLNTATDPPTLQSYRHVYRRYWHSPTATREPPG